VPRAAAEAAGVEILDRSRSLDVHPYVCKEALVRVSSLIAIGLMAVSVSQGAAQTPRNSGAPESFSASARVKSGAGAMAATIQIDIQRYTPDFDRTAVETGLKTGGYRGFLAALEKAPVVGAVVVGDQKFPIRWAREQKTVKGRTIVVVTDKPVFFVGGGRADAKPREGYDVALVQLQVDDIGLGTGSMAAAARVKPGGETGVQIDDYADEMITLATVSRKMR
jgi:hypothetical protein